MNFAADIDAGTKRYPTSADSIRALPTASPVIEIPISDVRPPDPPPRTAEPNAPHIRMLAESQTAPPPIVVHRATMRVVDGWHRLRAARLRGDTTIAGVFFDGSPAEAFILAVKLNAAHGLPMSLADRKVAAQRILSMYPEWSDRSIAAISGISHRTVAAIRKRSTGESAQPAIRIARNGVLHPFDGQQGRRRAVELFTANPLASAQEVASAAGISVTTAKTVRKQLRAGQRPAPPQQTDSERIDADAVLQRLRRDPSLRFSTTGRKLLRWLESPFEDGDWDDVVRSIPGHVAPSIAELARQRARDWQQLAYRLDRH